MSQTQNSEINPRGNAAMASAPENESLEARVRALEEGLEAEKARRHAELERETRERHRQFSLLLEEMSKLLEKMERRDLELEKGLRAELTRQNRFIYEEFQSRVSRLNALIEAESVAIRGVKVDRGEVRDLVQALLGESARRGCAPEALLR